MVGWTIIKHCSSLVGFDCNFNGEMRKKVNPFHLIEKVRET